MGRNAELLKLVFKYWTLVLRAKFASLLFTCFFKNLGTELDVWIHLWKYCSDARCFCSDVLPLRWEWSSGWLGGCSYSIVETVSKEFIGSAIVLYKDGVLQRKVCSASIKWCFLEYSIAPPATTVNKKTQPSALSTKPRNHLWSDICRYYLRK